MPILNSLVAEQKQGHDGLSLSPACLSTYQFSVESTVTGLWGNCEVTLTSARLKNYSRISREE